MTLISGFEAFGPEHWSLLDYIDICNQPKSHVKISSLDKAYLRTVSPAGLDTAPIISHLADGSSLPNHDDWACLDDLEEAGLCEIISQGKALVTLTDLGIRLAKELRDHIDNDGTFETFKPNNGKKPKSRLRLS